MKKNDLWGITGEVKNTKDLKRRCFVNRELAGKVLEMMVQVIVTDGAPVFFDTVLVIMHHRHKSGEQISTHHKRDKYNGLIVGLQMHGFIST